MTRDLDRAEKAVRDAARTSYRRRCRFCGELRDEGDQFAVIAIAAGHGTLAPGHYAACPDCARES